MQAMSPWGARNATRGALIALGNRTATKNRLTHREYPVYASMQCPLHTRDRQTAKTFIPARLGTMDHCVIEAK